jgi:hypothetical protein
MRPKITTRSTAVASIPSADLPRATMESGRNVRE